MPGELAGGQSGAELDQRQRVAAGLGDEPVLNALVHRTLGHRRQQLAGRGRGQPLDRQLVQAVEGQPPSGRLPDGEEGQHLGRLLVQPLCVVHDAHQGDRGRGVGQQRQDRQADQHPSGRGGRAQAEDGLQRLALGGGQRLQLVETPGDQLLHSGVGEFHLGLDAGDPFESQPFRDAGRVLEQGGLADSHTAAQHQRPATTGPHIGERLVDERALA